MSSMRIEHVNVTVTNPETTASLLQGIFGWRVRWRGPAMAGGRTVHVGTDRHYLALYAPAGDQPHKYQKGEPLNHVGIEVADIDAIEAKVLAAGLKPFSHGDYEPGRRFYFLDPDGIEFEVISYQ